MKLDYKIENTNRGYAADGLTKLEYTAIELMGRMITSGVDYNNSDLEYVAQQAVKAARVLARVLEAEEGG